jgi:hypothetical protein
MLEKKKMFKTTIFRKAIGFAVILILTLLALSMAETHMALAADTYVINASADTHSTISPSGNISASKGGSQTFTFAANGGYSISSVIVDGSPVSTTSPYKFNNIQTNHTISVSSSLNTYQITSSADSNSKIEPSGATAVNYGSSQTYRYSANTGYVVTSVLVDGNSAPINGNYIFTNIVANHTISVKSAIINFTITSSCDSHSKINPSGNVQVSYGNSQTFTYSANTGYNVSSVNVDGNPSSISTSFTFTNVVGNHSIAVNAQLIPTPTPSPTPKPSPTPTPSPSPSPQPTSEPTTPPTSEPTQNPTPQPTPNPTQATETPAATTHPKPTSTPTPSPKLNPTPTTLTPTSTISFNPNTISQSQTFTAGAVAAAVIGSTLAATLMVKRRQQASEYMDDFEIQDD